MRDYETVFILQPDLDEQLLEESIKKVQETLEREGAKITGINRWGKKRLAYDIKHHRDGYYVQINFQAEHRVPAVLEKTYRFLNGCLRYIIVHQDPKKLAKAARPAITETPGGMPLQASDRPAPEVTPVQTDEGGDIE